MDIGYAELFNWLRHMFHDEFFYEFIINSKTQAELKILKAEKFKSYELGTLPFELASSEEVRENIMYRYHKMKNRK